MADANAPYGHNPDGTPMSMADYANSQGMTQGGNVAVSNPNVGMGVPLDGSGGGHGSGGGGTRYPYPDVPDRFDTYDPNTGALKKEFKLDVSRERNITP